MNDLNDAILKSYGGVHINSLNSLLHLDEPDESEETMHLQMIKKSSYYDDENFLKFIENKQECFTVLSSNIESVHSKFNDLLLFIEQLREYNFEFSAICLQECWISESQDLTHLVIDGYTCIHQHGKIGRKGGLIIFLNSKFSYNVKLRFDKCDIWEGQFLYARHLTDVLCYGAVRLSVRPSVRPYVASSTILVGRI